MMNIFNLERLDDAIVYGIVNEKLRLECKNLDDFRLQFELNEETFSLKLDHMGCYYDPRVNQLRQK